MEITPDTAAAVEPRIFVFLPNEEISLLNF